jgi:indole-3-glycerol phosphate synthase
VKLLSEYARSIGLEVLLEIHKEEELDHICDTVDMVGVNNRDLANFSTSVETSLNLIGKIPQEFVPVTESGITNVETIVSLRNSGFKGFLIGEKFMSADDPAIAFADFIHQLKEIGNG